MNERFLITGVKSGIGKYLSERFSGVGFGRENAEEIYARAKQEGVDVILHAAFRSVRDVTTETLFPYIDDNVFLTTRLLDIPHRTFVFFSSVNVYPPSDASHNEEEVISLDAVRGVYGIAKLMAESLVRCRARRFVILRPTGLLGPYARKEGNLMRIFASAESTLSLTADSEMNYISYETVGDFIEIALRKNLEGIFNLASAKNALMGDIVNVLGRRATFGTFRYMAGSYDTRKAGAYLPALQKSSLEVIREFAAKYYP